MCSTSGSECPFYTKDGLGILESPNFPGEYPSNHECHWRVRPGRNKRILAIISNIQLDQDCGDLLTIRKTGKTDGGCGFRMLFFDIHECEIVFQMFQIVPRLASSSRPATRTTSPSSSRGTRGTSGSTLSPRETHRGGDFKYHF